MNIEFFVLDGYGQYVWPAFIFTFICFATLYRITKKELMKHEQMLSKEYEKLQTLKIKSNIVSETEKEVFSAGSI